MQQEQASRTALLIAASLVLLHHDAKYSRLVSKSSADLCAHVLEKHSSQTRLFSNIVQQTWFRPIAKLIERITIPGILVHYALRKKCVRGLVRSALANCVAQVVILGAGFDALSSELQREFPTARFWEIDHPATQRHKLRACFEIGIERVHFVAVDLSAAGLEREALISSGFDPAKRTFWIAEANSRLRSWKNTGTARSDSILKPNLLTAGCALAASRSSGELRELNLLSLYGRGA